MGNLWEKKHENLCLPSNGGGAPLFDFFFHHDRVQCETRKVNFDRPIAQTDKETKIEIWPSHKIPKFSLVSDMSNGS